MSTLRISLVVTLLITILSALTNRPVEAGSHASQVFEPPAQSRWVEIPTNQIIVKYRSNANLRGGNAPAGDVRMQMLDSATGVSLEYFRAMSADIHVLRLPSRLPVTQVQDITRSIEALPDVEYSEPDLIMFPALVPNDPQYGNQWHYFETYGINAPEAWDITIGSNSIRIAVIDTGITDHADLAGRWVGGYDFITDVSTANDGGGRDNDPHDPGNWITSAEASSGAFAGCPVTNSTWHGTHVAGTIGAAGNNGNGVVGVNWVSQIVPVRVLGKCGGFISDIADGMRWAAGLSVSGTPVNANPARVLNMSFGGPGVCSSTYQNAITAINAAGSIVVVAAGNNGSSLNTNSFQPANCNGVITVGAIDRGGHRAFYSNYGAIVKISAPGGETIPTLQNGVLSTSNTGTTILGSDTYGYQAGTSMAAPHVSGVISLMLSLNPVLTRAEVIEILQNTARAFPTGSGCTTSTCGSGIVDAAAALIEVGVPPATATPTKTATPPSTYTPTRTHTPTPTLTKTATVTSTATPSYTPTSTPNNTSTLTKTSTLTPTATSVFTSTPTLNNGFAHVDAYIGGVLKGTYDVAKYGSMRSSYSSVDNGPVRVTSTNNIPIVASERVAYFDGSNWTSHAELMGLPANQLTNSYVFPWYNNLHLNSQLRFGNVGTANTIVTVTIGGVVKGNYALAPNQSRRVSYAGLDSGPVKITSSANVPIIASMRVAYTPDGGVTWTSFSEMMGLPSNRLTNSYVFPFYNNVDLNSQLRFGNVGTTHTTVTVSVGGVVKGTYPLAPNQSKRIGYASLNAGPVKVTSSGGVPIIASLRVAYTPDDGTTWTDFSEMMGLPSNALSTHYSFPAYDNVLHNSQLRFGNVGTSNTTITVTINGVVKGNYPLAPNASLRISYSGLDSGPVVIRSSGGVPIIASLRVAYFDGSAWTSFAEMMGLPQAQLTTSYFFPWYNNVDLDTQLRFGVP